MENNVKLEERFKELTKEIVSLSSDETKTKELLMELVSVKGAMDIVPTELDCGKEIDSYSGNTFRIVETVKGVLFHEYGGYYIFARKNITSLHDTLVEIKNILKGEYEDIDNEEDKKATLQAMLLCLKLPQVVFSDADFLFKTATSIVELIEKYQDEADNAVPEEEDAEDLAEMAKLINSIGEEKQDKS